MMTDKEIIEEMAKALHDKIVDKTWRAEKVAEELYKIAVPEGSVIVSKQVWEEHIENREKANKIFEEKIRKETAREILDEVDNESNGQTKSITNLLREKYGIEIEESDIYE